jgi:diguanylate cyclase (GGDEF)-like protein
MDGIELCRRLRDKSRKYYHYILMITGRSGVQDVIHALESGADDCIGKPFGESELRARLLVASRILALQNELIQAREELRIQSMRDALTGLWNRTAFLDLLKREMDRAERTGGRTGLLLLDLDHFKLINDKYGHPTGDTVLKEVSRRMKENVRSYDFVGRYGGEEFFIAFAGCDREQLCERAESIRKAICDEPVKVDKGEIQVTLSIGAVVAEAGEGSVSEAIAVADVALYRAKDAGRNRVALCCKPRVEILQSSLTHRDCCMQCEPERKAQCVVGSSEMLLSD